MKNKNKLIAVIDIGSHSIRLFIGSIVRKGYFKDIENLWVPILIGKDTFSKGIISNQTIREVITVMKNFKEVIDGYKIDLVKAIGTSSIREAANADVLIERILNATGIRIEIIEPIVETRIFYNGVKRLMKDRFGFQFEKVLLFSIGGGATQIVLQNENKVIFSETHNQGTLRILRNFEIPEKFITQTLRPLSYRFTNTLNHFTNIEDITRFVVLNDDVLNLIKQIHEEKEVQGIYRITKKKILSFYNEVKAMTPQDLKKKFGINENVSGTTWVAFLLVGMLYKLTGAKEVLFPDISMSKAMLNQLSFREENLLKMDEETKKDVISAAHHIGRKFKFDETHADYVAKIALSIFDQMRDIYGFDKKERLYLEVAAILHDIGSFVSSSNHHKHSQRLISFCEILGLDNSEIQLIALIARYHRRAIPKPSHTDFTNLSREGRIIVSRLAAILRIADGIDNSHTQVIQDLKINIIEDKCEILVKLPMDKGDYLDILRFSVAQKSDLFENFFGLRVILESML